MADMTLHDTKQICMTHDTGLVTQCEISLITKHIIQYSYYDNEPAGDQFITFIASHHITPITNKIYAQDTKIFGVNVVHSKIAKKQL